MILWMIALGLLSALAIGPASFQIIRSLITGRTWPWNSILGFLCGDIIYIFFSVLLLRSPLLEITWVRNILTMITVLVLFTYAVKVLVFQKATDLSSPLQYFGFKKSLLLTLSNVHLVLIYTGLFLNITNEHPLHFMWGILIYFLAFVVGFLALLVSLNRIKLSLAKILRPLEVIVACGFLTFSVYLYLEIL